MQGLILFLGLTVGLAVLVAGLALGTQRWRTDRAMARLRAELGEETPRVVLPVLVGDGQRRGTGALALLDARIELRYSGAPPAQVRLKDIRQVSPQPAMRSLARYTSAAPTFGIVTRSGDTWDLVVMSGDRADLETLRAGLENR